MVYYRMLNIFPMLYSGALLFTHSTYNSLHLLIPNSQSFCPPAKASLILIDNDKLPITRIVPICTAYWKYTQGPMSLLSHESLKKRHTKGNYCNSYHKCRDFLPNL